MRKRASYLMYKKSSSYSMSLVLACLLLMGWALFPITAQTQQQVPSSAYQLFLDGRYEEALRVATAEIDRQPNNPNAYIVLGWTLLTTGRNSEALNAGIRALSLTPRDARAAGIVGEAHYNLGNLLEALPYLEQYVALEPSGVAVARIHAIMGEIFIEFSEYNHAEIAYGAAVQFDPQVSFWWQRLGFVREQLGLIRYAEEAYRRALELNPGSSELQTTLNRISGG